jgi:hypothetical protein
MRLSHGATRIGSAIVSRRISQPELRTSVFNRFVQTTNRFLTFAPCRCSLLRSRRWALSSAQVQLCADLPARLEYMWNHRCISRRGNARKGKRRIDILPRPGDKPVPGSNPTLIFSAVPEPEYRPIPVPGSVRGQDRATRPEFPGCVHREPGLRVQDGAEIPKSAKENPATPALQESDR